MPTFKRFQTPLAEMPDPHPHCACGEDIGLVRIVTPEGEHMCLECFDIKYPRWSSKNRFKKPYEQLEFPF